MKIRFKSGYYGVINGKEYSISSSDKGWMIYNHDIPESEPILLIDKKDANKKIGSAYVVRTKAKYQGFVFTIFQNKALKDEHKVRLKLNNLDFDAYDYYGFPYRKDDASIVVQEDELEEIWEERTPLARFPFKVDKIKYIKKEGKFL
tara:strand:- start:540 stop:980 length:441 start_codon:yes stop_codon:yes gene_type:complete